MQYDMCSLGRPRRRRNTTEGKTAEVGTIATEMSQDRKSRNMEKALASQTMESPPLQT